MQRIHRSRLIRWPSSGSPARAGFSVLEMLAVLTIVAAISAIVLARFSQNSTSAKQNACYTLKGHIEVQVQLWHRAKGAWPLADLSDIGAVPAYFPEGVPCCPVDGSAYVLDPATHRVTGHTH